MAVKSYIVKLIKEISGFNEKNLAYSADFCISTIDTYPGVPGVSKDGPGSTNLNLEVWCANLNPKLHNF